MEQEIRFDRRNFRSHSKANKKMIRTSLDSCGAGRSILIDSEGEIIAGNGVYEQAKALGIKTRIVETDGTELVVVKRSDLRTDDEKRKMLAAADNATSDKVEWNAEELLANLNSVQIESLQIDLPNIDLDGKGKEDVEEKKDDFYEKCMDDAMRNAMRDIMDTYNKIGGWQFVRKGTAEVDFVNFINGVKDYSRSNAIAFHPQMEVTANGGHKSIIEEYRSCIDTGKVNGERFIMDDGKKSWTSLYSNSQPTRGGKRILDFPASLARDLINEFCKDGGAVLDPCAGWGGRLVGFLASKAGSYTATDPAKKQIEGNTEMYERFKKYLREEKHVTLLCMPFEDYDIQECYFDFALTSPPYFDVERYEGGEQSHEKFNNYNLWRDGFYRQLITNVHKGLRTGGVFCLQVGSQKYPLLEDGKRIAEDVGFAIEDVRGAGMDNSNGVSDAEKKECILILRKV